MTEDEYLFDYGDKETNKTTHVIYDQGSDQIDRGSKLLSAGKNHRVAGISRKSDRIKGKPQVSYVSINDMSIDESAVEVESESEAALDSDAESEDLSNKTATAGGATKKIIKGKNFPVSDVEDANYNSLEVNRTGVKKTKNEKDS